MLPLAPVPAIYTPAAKPAPQVEAIALAALITRPRLGFRAGVGSWDSDTTAFVGADITLKVPGLPIPGLRGDIEGWSNFPAFTSGSNRGDAVSVMGVFSAFGIGYIGLGPSYWHTAGTKSDSGLGAKALVGINLISNLYVEGSTILGAKNVPIAVTVGMRF